MGRFFLFLCTLLMFNLSNAQIHEFGVWAGGSNYIGDIGATRYIAPKNLALGLIYKWNKSPRHSWRFSYLMSEIEASDSKSESTAKKQRNLSFKNSIQEFSAGMEFNFLDFNLHENQMKITPYIYSGLSYFFYSEKYFQNKNSIEIETSGQFAIPMVFGIK